MRRISQLMLAPVRQWRTYRLMAAHGPFLPYSTAWCLVALANDPAELPFVRRFSAQARMESGNAELVGVVVDVWAQIGQVEQARRLKWLSRYAETPLYRLGISEELIELAGLFVVEWALPPGSAASSIVVQQRGRRDCAG